MISHPYSLTFMMHDQLSGGGLIFLSFFLNHHARAYFKLRWIRQVRWIFEPSMVARLCDKYHNIALARLQFAHTNV